MQAAARPLILVVDDDEDIRSVLAIGLRQSFRVISVATGGEAVAQARATRPDVVVLDWTLPDMTGKELMDMISQLDPTFRQIRWVLVSGVAGLRGLAERVGAVACPKPCTVEVILQAIDGVLRGSST